MRHVLVDTNVYTAFKKNDSRIVEAFQRLDTIALDITVLAELLCGFRTGSKEKQNREELEEFLSNSRVAVLPHDERTAEFYSDIFLALRRTGRPVPVNDMWIAATAMQHGLALFTLDEHFSAMAGLLLKKDY